MKKILAIVVTYNRKSLLKECIKALEQQIKNKSDILIVDNASTDGTRDMVLKLKNPDIKYVNTGSNLGGAGGFNFGIKYAMQFDYDYLWIMDDDTIPNNTALSELINSAKILNDDFGFLSSKVLWTDGSLCKMNIPECSKNCFEKSDFLKYGMLKLDSTSFVSLFIKTSIVYSVGLPIKDFFIWGDDVEYTKRINRFNSNSYFVNDSIVIHKMKNNDSVNIVEENNKVRIPRFYNNYRNMFYVRKKESSKKVLLYLASTSRDFFKVLFKAKKYRIKKMWMIIKGFLSGLFFNPKIEYIENMNK